MLDVAVIAIEISVVNWVARLASYVEIGGSTLAFHIFTQYIKIKNYLHEVLISYLVQLLLKPEVPIVS